jgi:hypothetical protein
MPDSTPPRLTMRDVFASVSETFNLDRGIFRTLLDLVISPQAFFQTYFFQDRSKYSKPMTLLLLMLAAAVLSCRHFLPTNHSYSPNLFLTITASNQDELNRLTLIREYDDVLRLLLVPATSVLSYAVFPKQAWNFAEHLTFNAFILAFQFFLMALLVPLAGQHYEPVAGVAVLGYFLVTYQRCMQGPWLATLLKSIGVVIDSSLIFLALFYPLAQWVL